MTWICLVLGLVLVTTLLGQVAGSYHDRWKAAEKSRCFWVRTARDWEAQYSDLRNAVCGHHAQRGAVGSWENDAELYRAAGLEPGEPCPPPEEEQLRGEVERLRRRTHEIQERADKKNGYLERRCNSLFRALHGHREQVVRLTTECEKLRGELEAAEVVHRNAGAEIAAQKLREVAEEVRPGWTFGGTEMQAAAQAILQLRERLQDEVDQLKARPPVLIPEDLLERIVQRTLAAQHRPFRTFIPAAQIATIHSDPNQYTVHAGQGGK